MLNVLLNRKLKHYKHWWIERLGRGRKKIQITNGTIGKTMYAEINRLAQDRIMWWAAMTYVCVVHMNYTNIIIGGTYTYHYLYNECIQVYNIRNKDKT